MLVILGAATMLSKLILSVCVSNGLANNNYWPLLAKRRLNFLLQLMMKALRLLTICY
jgi:hypothetical protein